MTRLVVALTIALLAIPGISSSAIAGKPPKCDGLVATIVGTDKSQVIRGTPKRDVIVAKGGNDRIFAGGGNDVICAGPGNDFIDAGRGMDRVFGGTGNDVLKGGPGKDLLDGGPGKDGCYPAAGGDRIRNCEDADLAVSIVIVSPSGEPTEKDDDADAVADDGEAIEFMIRVRNLGAKRSGSYGLVLSQVETGVECGFDHSGTTAGESLWPGAFNETTYSIEDGCATQPGMEWNVTIIASADVTNPDADLTNNEATARIDVTPAVTLPAP